MPHFNRDELRKLSKEQLIDIVLELSQKVDALTKLAQEQMQLLERQRKRIETLERAAARSAAPFSKGKGKALRKKSGRRKGEGRFTNRKEPEVLPTDKVESIPVPLASDSCPDCGVELDIEKEPQVATITDVPTLPLREIRRFEIEVGICPKCGRKLRGEHPDLPVGQHGATAHRVGENVRGQAFALHYCSGLTLRKTSEAIGTLTGIDMTQSALTQSAWSYCREGGRLQEVYTQLRAEIADSPVVNTDDTGWRTAGKASYLMGFFTKTLAVYQIRPRHRHEEVIEVIGELFQGVLGTDRGTSYEATALSDVLQQKCLSHLLKNLSEVEKTKTGQALCFTRDLKKTLREGLGLWRKYEAGEIDLDDYTRRGNGLKKRLDHQLRPRELTDEDNQRMLEGIGRQNDEGRVVLFLDIPDVEPTNNRAERGLRSAVIARKVSQCSKNTTGERIYESMKSITETLKLRGHNVAQSLTSLLRGAPMPQPADSR